MSSIFGGQMEMPEWMRGLGADNRKAASALGQTLGTGLGALALMAGGDKDVDPPPATPSPSPLAPPTSARGLNQADPLRALHEQQLRLGSLQTIRLASGGLLAPSASSNRRPPPG